MSRRAEGDAKSRKWETSDKIAAAALAVSVIALVFSPPGESLYHAVFGPFGPSAKIVNLSVSGGIDKLGRCDMSVNAAVSAQNISSSDRMWLTAMTYSGEWYPIDPIEPVVLGSGDAASGSVSTEKDNPVEIAVVLVPSDNQGQLSQDLKSRQGLSGFPPGSVILGTTEVNKLFFE